MKNAVSLYIKALLQKKSVFFAFLVVQICICVLMLLCFSATVSFANYYNKETPTKVNCNGLSVSDCAGFFNAARENKYVLNVILCFDNDVVAGLINGVVYEGELTNKDDIPSVALTVYAEDVEVRDNVEVLDKTYNVAALVRGNRSEIAFSTLSGSEKVERLEVISTLAPRADKKIQKLLTSYFPADQIEINEKNNLSEALQDNPIVLLVLFLSLLIGFLSIVMTLSFMFKSYNKINFIYYLLGCKLGTAKAIALLLSIIVSTISYFVGLALFSLLIVVSGDSGGFELKLSYSVAIAAFITVLLFNLVIFGLLGLLDNKRRRL